MSRYEFYVPPLRDWPARWLAAVRAGYRPCDRWVRASLMIGGAWTTLRRDPPWEIDRP